MTKSILVGLRHFGVFLFVGFFPLLSMRGQTFRGGINGTVTDVQGALVANAKVTAVDVSTGVVHSTTSSSGGEFLFQDLQLGSYSVTVTMSGFATAKYDKIPVSAGTT